MDRTEFEQLADNLQATQDTLEDVRDVVSDLDTATTPFKAALTAIEKIAGSTDKIKKAIDFLELQSKVLENVPVIGTPVKALTRALDTVGKIIDPLEAKLEAIATKTAPLKTKLQEVSDNLERTEFSLFSAEQTLEGVRENVLDGQFALELLGDLGDEESEEVTSLRARLEQGAAPINDVMDALIQTKADAEAKMQEVLDLVDPLSFDIGILADLEEDYETLEDILDTLSTPFEFVLEKLEPFLSVLQDLTDFLSALVSAAIDPILDSFGLLDLIDEAGEKLIDLLPGVDLIDPFDGVIDELTSTLSGVDLSFDGLTDFLGVFELVNGVVDTGSDVVTGFPFDLSLFSITPVALPEWKQYRTQVVNADPAGGFTFGDGTDQIINGGIGTDLLFGAGGDDTITSDGTGEPAGASNVIIGGAGDDDIHAFGTTIVSYKGEVTEFKLTFDLTAGDGPLYVDIDHLEKVGSPDDEGKDRVYYDATTLIQFGGLHTINLAKFLAGYQAATAENPDLVGDRDGPTEDFLIAIGLDPVANKLEGLALDDFLAGGPGLDTLLGGDDNDYLLGGPGFDSIDGGNGDDLTSFVDLTSPTIITPVNPTPIPFGDNATRGAQVWLDRLGENLGDGFYQTDQVINVENVRGSDFNDIFFGQANGDNILAGEKGDDILRGIGAGTEGNWLAGGDGMDALVLESGRAEAYGGRDNDVFYVSLGAQHLSDSNLIDGGTGLDVLSYYAGDHNGLIGALNSDIARVLVDPDTTLGPEVDFRTNSQFGHLTVDAAAGTITRHATTGETATDTYTGIEAVVGSSGDDRFTVGVLPEDTSFHGGAGSNLFIGLGSGLDSQGNRDFDAVGNALHGGAFSDTFELYGAHSVYGGTGNGSSVLDLSKSEGFWAIDMSDMRYDAGPDNGLLHLANESELPDIVDHFFDMGAVNYRDPRPTWYDDSLPDSGDDPERFDSFAENDDARAVGMNIVLGTDRRDVIIGGRETVALLGGGGDDQLAIRFDADPTNLSVTYPERATLYGEDGDDYLIGHYGAERLFGGDGNDTIDLVANEFEGDDPLLISQGFGGRGADLFHALDYNEDRNSLRGVQQVWGGESTYRATDAQGRWTEREHLDAIDFGDGEVSHRNEEQGSIGVGIALDNAFATLGQARGVELYEIESIFGTRWRDILHGDDGDNILVGRGGRDELVGKGGDDVLIGGLGADALDGGDGNDTFVVNNNGASDDDGSGNPATRVTGGAGIDTLSFEFAIPDGRGGGEVLIDAIGRASVDLSGDTATTFDPDPDYLTGDEALIELTIVNGISDIENVIGGAQADRIAGDAQANVLIGGDGNDTLFGRGGGDTLIVGRGADVAYGDAGDDTILGGEGRNVYEGGQDNDLLDITGNSLGQIIDLDDQSITATYGYTGYYFSANAEVASLPTLAEQEAYTVQNAADTGGSSPRVFDMTAEDVHKMANPVSADKFIHVFPELVRATLDNDGNPLSSFAYTEFTEDRTYRSTFSGIETIRAGAGNEDIVFGDASSFAGHVDGGLGFDTLDLTGLSGAVTLSHAGSITTVLQNGAATGLTFENIEQVEIDPGAGGVVLLNTAPVARGDAFETDLYTAFTTGNVLDNDADGNPGSILSVARIDTSQTQGAVTDNGDGTFDYDPGTAFDALPVGSFALDQFTYTVTDGAGAEDTATVYINVDVIEAPVPVLDATSPADDAANVPVSAELTLSFRTFMEKGTGQITLYRADTDSVVEAIDVTSDQVTVDLNTVTINPTADLPALTGIYVLIDAGALTDQDGDAYAGISDPGVFNFTTADARSLVVDTVLDVVDAEDGLTSLREAIAFANDATVNGDGDADGDGNARDTVRFDASLAGQTLTLTEGQIAITGALHLDGDLDGNGTRDITLDGNGARIFNVTGAQADAAIHGVTMTGGTGKDAASSFPFDTFGGAIRFESAAAGHLGNVAITDSTSLEFGAFVQSKGGGLSVSAGSTVTIDGSTISGNSALEGGGIYNAGTLTILNSTIRDNTAGDAGDGGGGGVFNDGDLTLTNVTINANFAENDGGGIYSTGTLTAQNLTLYANAIQNDVLGDRLEGGGLFDTGTTTLTNASIVENTAVSRGNSSSAQGAGVAGDGATVLIDSIVAGNVANDRAVETVGITQQGTNLTGAAVADIFGSGYALADNGGPVATLALDPTTLFGAFATDAATGPSPTATDARGAALFDVTGIDNNTGASLRDLGAYEYRPAAPEITTGGVFSNDENQTFVADFNAVDDFGVEGAGLRYAISGTDAALFAIDAQTGALSFRAAPDFEAPDDAGGDNTYALTVSVTDDDANSDSLGVTISVRDVFENRAPKITVASAITVTEEITAPFAMITTDDDVDSIGSGLSFALAGGADAAAFVLDPATGALRFATSPDFERPGDANGDNTYEISVAVTDSGGLSDVRALTIAVDDVATPIDASGYFARGTARDDAMSAGAFPIKMLGLEGDDVMTGSTRKDKIFGNDGNDTITGGQGSDAVFGGTGQDRLSGDHGRDRLAGGSGADTLLGGGAIDTIFGGDGDDLINGGAARDVLYGGAGADEIRGGDGADVLNGGLADDWLSGGTGADGFVFRGQIGNDTVADFERGTDQLRIDEEVWSRAVQQVSLDTSLTQSTLNQIVQTDEAGLTITLIGAGTIRLDGVTDALGLVDDIVLV